MPTFTLPDTAHGGAITVSAPNLGAAQQQAANQTGVSLSQQQGGGTFGINTNPDIGGGGSGSGGGGGGGGGSGNSGNSSAGLDASFQKMLAALASGNQAAFDEAKREFNVQFDQSKLEYDNGRTDALDQFAKNFGLSVAQITGSYNGQPTEQARQFNANLANNQSQFGQTLAGNLGTTLLDAATKLRGPQDYLQYQNYTHGGQTLYDQLTGTEAIPQTGAPTGPLQSVSLASVMQQLGLLPAGTSAGGGGAAPAPTAGTPAAPAPAPATAPAPTTPAARMYGAYSLDQVAQAIQAQGGDVAKFNQLMNDTSNPSSLNWAIYSATGGKVTTIEQLGVPVAGAPVAGAPPAGAPPAGTPATGGNGGMYGQYSLQGVASQIQAQGGDVNKFWQLMNDTSNPSSLNWAVYSATGGKYPTIDALAATGGNFGPMPGEGTGAAPRPASPATGITDPGYAAPGAGVRAGAPATGSPVTGITDPGYAPPSARTDGGNVYNPMPGEGGGGMDLRSALLALLQRPSPQIATPQPGQTSIYSAPSTGATSTMAAGDTGIFPGEGGNTLSREQIGNLRNQNAMFDRYGMSPGQSLNPNQINPARWDAMGQIGQQLTKNLAETNFGYDANDFERQINAQRPMGQAPRMTRSAPARATGLF